MKICPQAFLCAVLCYFFVGAAFGQSIQEELTGTSPIYYTGGSAFITPCTGYTMQLTLTDFNVGDQFEIVGLNAVGNTIFGDASSTDDVTINPVIGTSTTIVTINEDAAITISIPVVFTSYTGGTGLQTLGYNGIGGLTISATQEPVGVLDIQYDISTTYYDDISSNDIDISVGEEATLGDTYDPEIDKYSIATDMFDCNLGDTETPTACLYYQNMVNQFSRITYFDLADQSFEGLEGYGVIPPTQLEIEYIREFEIDLTFLSFELVGGDDPAPLVFDPPIPAVGEPNYYEFTIPSDWLSDLASGARIRMVEEFSIVGCGTGDANPVSTVTLKPCLDAQLNQNYNMNVSVQDNSNEIRSCLHIDGVNGQEGIPLFTPDLDNGFSVSFIFENRNNGENTAPLTAHKEIGYIVVPVDLHAMLEDDDLDPDVYLLTPGNVQLSFEPTMQGFCDDIDLTENDEEIVNAPADFATMYLAQCDQDNGDGSIINQPNGEDRFWRIQLDFSTLDEAWYTSLGANSDFVDLALSDWFSEDGNPVYNTFLENTRFSVTFNNLRFDLDEMARAGNQGDRQISIAEEDVLFSDIAFHYNMMPFTEPDLGCTRGLWTMFEIPSPRYFSGEDDGLTRSYYSVDRDMCQRLLDLDEPMSPHSKMDMDALTCQENVNGEVNNRAYNLHNSFVDEIIYENQRMDVEGASNVPGIIVPGQTVEITFDYGWDVDLDPWTFHHPTEPNHKPRLFQCENSEMRTRIAIPYPVVQACNVSFDVQTGTDIGDGTPVYADVLDFDFIDINTRTMTVGTGTDCLQVFVINGAGERESYADAISAGGILDNGECTDDCTLYVDFPLEFMDPDGGSTHFGQILVSATWVYTNADGTALCPGCDDCQYEGGTATDYVAMTTYSVCVNDPADLCPADYSDNFEAYVLQLGCETQPFIYVCGETCDVAHCYTDSGIQGFQSCTLDGGFAFNDAYLELNFNTDIWDDLDMPNPFVFKRQSTGYIPTPLIESYIDTDGNPQDFTYTEATGYTADQIENDLVLLDYNLIDPLDVRLAHIMSGDRINVEASGIYNPTVYADQIDDGSNPHNPYLVFVVQIPCEYDDDYLQLPCIAPNSPTADPDDLVSIVFRPNNNPDAEIGDPGVHQFFASEMYATECIYMEDDPNAPLATCGNDGLPDLMNSYVFVFDDFYTSPLLEAPDGTNGYDIQFDGLLFMDPGPSPTGGAHLDEIVKGAFGLLGEAYQPDTPGQLASNYCPTIWSCDNGTEFANFHEVRLIREDFQVAGGKGIFGPCTRPFRAGVHFSTSAGEVLEEVWEDEYRPVMGIESLTLTNNDPSNPSLFFDHGFYGSPSKGRGLWYTRSANNWSEEETFFTGWYSFDIANTGGLPVNPDNYSLTISGEGIGYASILASGEASRFIYGAGEVRMSNDPLLPWTLHQQIGHQVVDSDLALSPHLLTDEGVIADLEWNYLLDDEMEAYEEESCNGGISVPEVTLFNSTEDLETSVVGFSSAGEFNNELSSSTGHFYSNIINFHDLTTEAGPSGNSAVMSFFVTLEEQGDEVFNVSNVELEKFIDDVLYETYQPRAEQTGTNDLGTPTNTFYFHQDYTEPNVAPCNVDNVHLNCSREETRMFVDVGAPQNVRWRLKFCYEMNESCGGVADDPLSNPLLDGSSERFNFYYGQACADYVMVDIDGGMVEQLRFNRCQVCPSPTPDCPDCDCAITPDLSETDSDTNGDGFIGIQSLLHTIELDQGAYPSLLAGNPYLSDQIQEYSPVNDGFVGEIWVTWGNEGLVGQLDWTVNENCEPQLCLSLENSSDALTLDAWVNSVQFNLPEGWESYLSSMGAFLTNCDGVNDGAQTFEATLEDDFLVDFASDLTTCPDDATVVTDGVVLSGGTAGNRCLKVLLTFDPLLLPNFDDALHEISFSADATSICGYDMEVDNEGVIQTIQIDEIFAIDDFSSTGAFCGQNDGTITINSSLQLGVDYNWTLDGVSMNTTTVSDLYAGSYAVTIEYLNQQEYDCFGSFDIVVPDIGSQTDYAGTLNFVVEDCQPQLCLELAINPNPLGPEVNIDDVVIAIPNDWLPSGDFDGIICSNCTGFGIASAWVEDLFAFDFVHIDLATMDGDLVISDMVTLDADMSSLNICIPFSTDILEANEFSSVQFLFATSSQNVCGNSISAAGEGGSNFHFFFDYISEEDILVQNVDCLDEFATGSLSVNYTNAFGFNLTLTSVDDMVEIPADDLWNWNYLELGDYELEVTYTDLFGNEYCTPAPFEFTIDELYTVDIASTFTWSLDGCEPELCYELALTPSPISPQATVENVEIYMPPGWIPYVTADDILCTNCEGIDIVDVSLEEFLVYDLLIIDLATVDEDGIVVDDLITLDELNSTLSFCINFNLAAWEDNEYSNVIFNSNADAWSVCGELFNAEDTGGFNYNVFIPEYIGENDITVSNAFCSEDYADGTVDINFDNNLGFDLTLTDNDLQEYVEDEEWSWSGLPASDYVLEVIYTDLENNQYCTQEWYPTIDPECCNSSVVAEMQSDCVLEMTIDVSNVLCDDAYFEWEILDSDGIVVMTADSPVDIVGTEYNGPEIYANIELPDGQYEFYVNVYCGNDYLCSSATDTFTLSGCAPPIGGCNSENNCKFINDENLVGSNDPLGRAILSPGQQVHLFGSAHQDGNAGDEDYLMLNQDLNYCITDRNGFGETSNLNGNNEVIEDAIIVGTSIYAVGHGQYAEPDKSPIARLMVSKMDLDGTVQEKQIHHFGLKSASYATCITHHSSNLGEFLLVGGYTRANKTADHNMFILKLSMNFNVLDARIYYSDDNQEDYCYDIDCVNKMIVAVGESNGFGAGIVVDTGTLNLTNNFRINSTESRVYAVHIVGYNEVYYAGGVGKQDRDVLWFEKAPSTFADGSLQTTRTDINNWDEAHSMILQNGDFYLAGNSIDTQDGGLVLKLDGNGVADWGARMVQESVFHDISYLASPDLEFDVVTAVGEGVDANGDRGIVNVRVNTVDPKIENCCLDKSEPPTQSFGETFDQVFKAKQTGVGTDLLLDGQVSLTIDDICVYQIRTATAYESETAPTQLSIIPNPNNGQFDLKVGIEEGFLKRVTLLDTKGLRVEERTFSAEEQIGQTSFDVRTIPAGVYLIQVELSNGERITSRVVVQR